MSLAERGAIAFESCARFLMRRRFVAIGVLLCLAAALATQLPDLRWQNDPGKFLHRDDPAVDDYLDFLHRFDRDALVLVAIQPPEVFDPAFLAMLRSLHADLRAEVPHVDEIYSLINARWTHGSGDELIVEDLLPDDPEPAELPEIERRVRSNPFYRDLLISRDGRTTAILIRPAGAGPAPTAEEELAGFDDVDPERAADGGAEQRHDLGERGRELVAGVERVVQRYRRPDTRFLVTGTPVLEVALNDAMGHDTRVFVLLASLAMAVILGALFRRLSAVILPILIVGLSVVSTMGAMAGFGVELSLVTGILPAFLLVVGVCDSIHILTIVYQGLEQGKDRRDAIAEAFGHSGMAVLLTSLTTACGLFSFWFSGLVPTSQLGVFAPLGVMLALLFTVGLLPPVLASVPLRARPPRRRTGTPGLLVRALIALGDAGVRHPWKIVVTSALLLVGSLVGASQLRISFDPLRWFPEDDPFRRATERVDRELRGSVVLEVVVDADAEGAIQEPELLRRLAAISDYALSVESGGLRVGKSLSVVDVVEEIHQALNEERPEYHVIPGDRSLVAQELLLFEASGSDDLEDFVTQDFSTARITLRLPEADGVRYASLLDELDGPLRAILGDLGELRITGVIVLLARTSRAILASMASSYLFAILAITPIMVLLLGDLRWGLISMVPNLLPVAMVLGLMHWSGIPLDATTFLVGGIIIGLAVDDTIHFMHRFAKYFDQTGDVRQSVRATLETTGSAMLSTSLVLAAGFFIFALGYMVNVVHFGLLAGFATVVAFLADVVLAPALLSLTAAWRVRARGGIGFERRPAPGPAGALDRAPLP